MTDKRIYVNSAWAGAESGTELEPYNAFADITVDDWTDLNAAAVAGDEAIITATGTFRETLTAAASGTASKYIVINLTDATILASETFNSTSDWTNESGNIWITSTTFELNVGFIMFGDKEQDNVGSVQDNEVDLAADKDHWSENDGVLKVYSSGGNPASVWSNIEVTSRRYCLDLDGQSYLDVYGLTSMYSNSASIKGIDVSYIKFHDNTFGWCGGRDAINAGRAGNGIQFDGSSHHLWIYDNFCEQTYDAGIGPHCYTTNGIMTDVFIYDNTVHRCGAGIGLSALTGTGIVVSGEIYNNTITESGMGWSGFDNSVDGKGITSRTQPGNTVTTTIYGNTIVGHEGRGIGVACDIGGTSTTTIYKNKVSGGLDNQGNASDGGIVISGDVTANVYSNVITNQAQYGILNLNNDDATVLTLTNNTVSGFGDGFHAFRSWGSANELVYNNIFSGSGVLFRGDLTFTATLDYNLYFRPTGTDLLREGSTEYDTLDAWYAATGQDEHSVVSDPLLLSTGKVKVDSPALLEGIIIEGVNDSGTDIWGNSSYRTNIGAYWGYGMEGGGGDSLTMNGLFGVNNGLFGVNSGLFMGGGFNIFAGGGSGWSASDGGVQDYLYYWAFADALTEYTGMDMTVARESAASYVDTDGILQIADGDSTPFSHSSQADATNYVNMRGSFVDGQAWFDGEVLGSELFTQTTDISHADWATTGSSFTTGTDGWTAAADDDYLFQDPITEEGVLYVFSITLSTEGQKTNIRFQHRFSETGSSTSIPLLTNIPTRYSITLLGAVGGGIVRFGITDSNSSDWALITATDFSVKQITASLADQAGTANLLIIDDGTNKGYGYCGEAGTGEAFDNGNLFDQDGGAGGVGDKGGFVLEDLRLAELSSGSLTVGTMYEISAQSLLNFTTDGAPDSVVGTTFIATGTTLTLTAADKVYPVDISWAPVSTNEVSIDSDALRITSVVGGSVNGAYLSLTDATDLTSELEIGKLYKITGTAKVGSGDSVDIVLQTVVGDNPEVTIISTDFTPFELYFVASDTDSERLRCGNMGSGEEIWLDNLQISEVTAPGETAVHIYKDYELTTSGWNAKDTDLDLNPAAWDFDVYANLMSSSGSTAEPRIESTGVMVESFEGTNWCLHSNGFDEWTLDGVTVAQNVTGPDGIENSAWTITDLSGDTNNSLRISDIGSPVSGTNSYSVFVKEGTSSKFSLFVYDSDGLAYRVNISFQWIAGVLSTETETTGTGYVEKIGSTDWWRITIQCPSIVAGNLNRLYLAATKNTVDPGSAVTTIFYGAQFEATPYATSYIPTTTIPVTRTADAHSCTMSTAFKNLMGDVADSPFTMVCEWTPKFDYWDTSGYSSIITPTTSTAINLFYAHSVGFLGADSGLPQSVVDPNYTANTTYIFALRVYDDAGTMKFEVGEKHGGSWTWDEIPAAYDGSFNPGTDFLIGNGNDYPFNLKNLVFYGEQTQAWIEANY